MEIFCEVIPEMQFQFEKCFSLYFKRREGERSQFSVASAENNNNKYKTRARNSQFCCTVHISLSFQLTEIHVGGKLPRVIFFTEFCGSFINEFCCLVSKE